MQPHGSINRPTWVRLVPCPDRETAKRYVERARRWRLSARMTTNHRGERVIVWTPWALI